MVRLRGDIEGLRALAVLAVVLHHAFPAWLPGGFVGVDVFFVLSGYVISSSLLAAAGEHGPLLTAAEYAELGAQVAAAGVFANNLLLWTQAGYFDAASATKPLLHLWSLGVEEQFYLVLPLALWPLRSRLPAFAKTVLVAAVLSYAAWVVSCEIAPSSGFYLLHARFWELATGVLLACAHQGAFAWPSGARVAAAARWLAPAALTVLLASFLLFHDGAWPHPLAVLPVVATALLLHVNRDRHDPLLASRPLVRIGGISYAFYLWHWPALVYWRMKWPDLAGTWLLAPVLVSLLLSFVTLHLVETPVRFGRWRSRRWVPAGLAAGLAGAAVAGGMLHLAEGFPDRFPAMQRVVQPGAEAQAAWRPGRCFFYADAPTGYAPECFGGDPATTIALWGDSHAAHLYPGFRALWAGKQPVAQLTAASCPPTLVPLPGERRALCAPLREQALARLQVAPPATVVLSAYWRNYTDLGLSDAELVAEIAATARRLKSWGVGQVVVIGPGPVWAGSLPASLHRHMRQHGLDEAPERFAGADARMEALDAALAKGLRPAPVGYLSALGLLCGPGGCQVRDPRSGAGEFFYFDQAHLSVPGSIHFARLAAAKLRP